VPPLPDVPPPSSSAANRATLLVSCPDRKGIVAALAQVLYGHGANILDADQHTDAEAGQFFQRIRVDLAEIHTDRVAVERAVAEVAERLGLRYRFEYAERKKNVALFVSRYGHCLHDLLWRHRLGELACNVRLIIANHPDLEDVARQFGIPFHVIPVLPNDKARAEAEQMALVQAHDVDLIVFARYMQIVSAQFIERYPGRIINIHHSFLPAFVGQRPYHQAHARGVKLIGATAHYATADLDEGPIIEQDVARISHRDDVEDLVRKGRDLEKMVLARAVRLHLEDRILVYGNKTVVFD
jgi:formyltetrahydrofolate deformylase